MPIDAQTAAGAKALDNLARIGRGMTLTRPEAIEAARCVLRAAERVRDCPKCKGLGYLVADAEWEPYAVQCDCIGAVHT